MEKFKICPVCGMHNKPNMIECLGCETDLTSVKATDEETEKTKNDAQESEVSKSQEEYVRMCDCGAVNSATTKKCTECGEDISDIAPTLNEQRSECVFVMASVDGTYVFEIKEGEVVIGREHEMKEYLMNKLYVSRQHAKLIKEADRVFIENLSGTNYTFVNNQRIAERTELKFDDEIGLGGNEVNGKRQDEAAYLVLRSI
ncbi:MAG: FHA domain-containing protein [Lachnospiraceae bacterium]|nr:FHA domain-containing protein [Lachnospiraceae bacterium]